MIFGMTSLIRACLCVSTQDQYCFIFKAVLEGLVLGETTLSLAEFTERISQLAAFNEISGKSRIETEFQVLVICITKFVLVKTIASTGTSITICRHFQFNELPFKGRHLSCDDCLEVRKET